MNAYYTRKELDDLGYVRVRHLYAWAALQWALQGSDNHNSIATLLQALRDMDISIVSARTKATDVGVESHLEDWISGEDAKICKTLLGCLEADR